MNLGSLDAFLENSFKLWAGVSWIEKRPATEGEQGEPQNLYGKMCVARIYALMFVVRSLFICFGGECGSQLKQETILDSHGMSGATCFCYQQFACLQEGLEDTMSFQSTVFPIGFPVDGKVSMILSWFSISFQNSHFILQPILNFANGNACCWTQSYPLW